MLFRFLIVLLVLSLQQSGILAAYDLGAQDEVVFEPLDQPAHDVVKRATVSSVIYDNETYYQITPPATGVGANSYRSTFNAAFAGPNVTVVKYNQDSNGTWSDYVKVQLKFLLYFFGHPVGQIAVSKNGYIFIPSEDHDPESKQESFIAPFGADFRAVNQTDAAVSYVVTNSSVWVRWANLVLPVPGARKVSFQCTIASNGSMVFSYYNVNLTGLNATVPGFRAGVADVFNYKLEDKGINEIFVHKAEAVNIIKIVNNSIAYVTAIPSCGQLTDCSQCLKAKLINFTCNWCFELGQCGSVPQRKLQYWLNYPCHVPADSQCKVGGPIPDEMERAARGILAFFLALFLAILVSFFIFICVYGHRKPDSRIGRCLLQTRQQIKKRFTGLPRLPNVAFSASNPQVRLEEEADYENAT